MPALGNELSIDIPAVLSRLKKESKGGEGAKLQNLRLPRRLISAVIAMSAADSDVSRTAKDFEVSTRRPFFPPFFFFSGITAFLGKRGIEEEVNKQERHGVFLRYLISFAHHPQVSDAVRVGT